VKWQSLDVSFHHVLCSTASITPHRAQQGNAIPQTQINEDAYCQGSYDHEKV